MPTMPHMRFNIPKSTRVASQPASLLTKFATDRYSIIYCVCTQSTISKASHCFRVSGKFFPIPKSRHRRAFTLTVVATAHGNIERAARAASPDYPPAPISLDWRPLSAG